MEDLDAEEFLDKSKDDLEADRIDAENDENLEQEDLEKIKSDVADMKDSIDKMNETNEELKKTTEPGAMKTLGKFLITTTAVAVIFFFVTFGLSKLSSSGSSSGGGGGGGGSDDKKKRKAAVLQALTELSKDVRNLGRLMAVWFTAHQDEKIIVGGFEVPLIDIFTNYTTPMNAKMNAIFKKLKTLSRDDNGKTVFSIPSVIQVNAILTDFGGYIDILPNLLKFVQENGTIYPTVKTFPLEQSDIDNLKKNYDTAKKLPF